MVNFRDVTVGLLMLTMRAIPLVLPVTLLVSSSGLLPAALPVPGAVPASLPSLLPAALAQGAKPLQLDKLKVPQGFKVQLYKDGLPNARSMALSPFGTLFVGTRTAGSVYALVDKDKDGKAEESYVIAKGLNMPNGVAFRNGSLYVAEINRIIRFDNIEQHLKDPPAPVVVSTNFPDKRHHGWKFIRFGLMINCTFQLVRRVTCACVLIRSRGYRA